MTDEFEAALASELNTDSPDTGLGEQGSTDDMPQGILDLANDFLNISPEESPAEEVEESAEASEAEEQNSEDINEDIEAEAEESEENELSDEKLPDSVVDYDELKGHTLEFRVGGETRQMTIDQIVSELGQVKAASKAQSEVKSQQDEISKIREDLEKDRAFFEQQQKTAVESHQLGQKRANIENAQNALNQARQRGDVNAMVKIKDDIERLSQDYQQSEAAVRQVQEEAEARLVAEQEKKLEDMGYGSLLSDTQRLESLTGYVNNNLSTTAAQAINYDASLLVAVEKARLWDASQSKKGKLKSSGKKTLKAGSGKVSQPKKEVSADDAFASVANSILGIS